MLVQSDHDDLRPFVRQFNAVVISYLDGALPFDAAADQLAAIIRAEHERPRTDEETKQQRDDLERWGKEAAMLIVHDAFVMAEGRSSADQAKAGALFHAAMRRVLPSSGAA